MEPKNLTSACGSTCSSSELLLYLHAQRPQLLLQMLQHPSSSDAQHARVVQGPHASLQAVS
jgi:hypothetical protein